jgi:ribonucleoside-diphosphate reductase alpha chain
MANLILTVNEAVAAKVGIRPTARATCVKPAGTTSCILGTSSGIHAHHAKRYFRRAQGNELEAPLQYFSLHNPKHVEQSVWSANGTDKVVTFCIETSDEALTKDTVNALKLLDFVKLTQANWVDAGRVLDRCAASFLRHNVSNTINIQPDEWADVEAYIYDNRDYFAGISLLSHSGDKDYPQAPFCQVFTPGEIIDMYGDGSLMASGLIVDGLHAFKNNLWAACDCALGIGEELKQPVYDAASFDGYREKHDAFIAKTDWVRRARKFADNYFGGDIKRMTYCLKDVNNWKQWCDLNRVYQPVDWSLLHEDSDTTKSVVLDAACAGGKCEVLS